MVKLIGLNYVICFRKGKENVTANTLSHYHEEGMIAAISTVIPNWLQEVTDSYKKGDWTKRLLE